MLAGALDAKFRRSLSADECASAPLPPRWIVVGFPQQLSWLRCDASDCKHLGLIPTISSLASLHQTDSNISILLRRHFLLGRALSVSRNTK